MIHYKETEYGFEYGPAKIIRCCSNEKKRWSILSLETPKEDIQIYVTKTGKVRFFDKKGNEFKREKK